MTQAEIKPDSTWQEARCKLVFGSYSKQTKNALAIEFHSIYTFTKLWPLKPREDLYF